MGGSKELFEQKEKMHQDLVVKQTQQAEANFDAAPAPQMQEQRQEERAPLPESVRQEEKDFEAVLTTPAPEAQVETTSETKNGAQTQQETDQSESQETEQVQVHETATTTTTRSEQETRWHSVSEETLISVYEQSAAAMEEERFNRKIDKFLPKPDFHLYKDSELENMGKIRRNIHRVKRYYYRKRLNKARNAAIQMLTMKNRQDAWDLEANSPEPLYERANKYLHHPELMPKVEGMNKVNEEYYAAWKEILLANNMGMAIGALQCFCTIMPGHIGVEGKHQWYELINAYMAANGRLEDLPEEIADKLRREPYLMKYAKAINQGMRLAVMPNTVVMQKQFSYKEMSNILGVHPDDVDETLDDLAQEEEPGAQFVSAGVTVASTNGDDTMVMDQRGERPIEFVILAHKGTHGIPIDGTELNQYGRNQNAYALAANTKFQIMHVERRTLKDGNSGWRITVETVPQDGNLRI